MQSPESEHPVSLEPWWHPISVEVGQGWQYAVGSLWVYLFRQPGQWSVASKQLDDTQDHYRVVSEPTRSFPDGLKFTRYVFDETPEEFCLSPRSLDRPVVVKTNQPVQVPPGENVTFYISSPILVNVCLPKVKIPLQELATVRLSDTWFGPSTRVGEMCYAAKTHARNLRNEVPLRPHRAVTPVTIRNHSSAFLAIEKLSIPVPFLAIYGAEDGNLWTDPVVLTHTEGEVLAGLTIGKEKPRGTRLAEPRSMPQKNGLVRAFANMLMG